MSDSILATNHRASSVSTVYLIASKDDNTKQLGKCSDSVENMTNLFPVLDVQTSSHQTSGTSEHLNINTVTEAIIIGTLLLQRASKY